MTCGPAHGSTSPANVPHNFGANADSGKLSLL